MEQFTLIFNASVVFFTLIPLCSLLMLNIRPPMSQNFLATAFVVHFEQLLHMLQSTHHLARPTLPMLPLNCSNLLKKSIPQSHLILQRLFIRVPTLHRPLQIPRLNILRIMCRLENIWIPILMRTAARDRSMRLLNMFRVAANLLPLVLMATPLCMVTPQIPISLLCQNQTICR